MNLKFFATGNILESITHLEYELLNYKFLLTIKKKGN